MTGGAEGEVDRVAIGTGEVIWLQEAVLFHVANDRLDDNSASNLPVDGG